MTPEEIEELMNVSLDLGNGVTLKWVKSYDLKSIVGGIIKHPDTLNSKYPGPDAGFCSGAFWLKGNSYNKQPEWDLTGDWWNPTLSPSFLCHCGFHGWVREAKWEGA